MGTESIYGLFLLFNTSKIIVWAIAKKSRKCNCSITFHWRAQQKHKFCERTVIKSRSCEYSLSKKSNFNWKVLSHKNTRLSWTQIQTVQRTDGAGETYDKKNIWWKCSWNNSILTKVLLVFSCVICVCKSTTKVPFSSTQSKIAQFCNLKPTKNPCDS